MSVQIKNDIQNLRDMQWIASVVDEDHDAFKKLYYAYNGSVVKFLTALLGSQQIAEDIAQDIFAYIWENRQKLTSVRHFKSYLFTIARNASFKFIRQDQRLCGLSDETDLAPGAESYASDEQLMAEETKLLISIAVSRMPKLRRTVFSLSRDEGLTHEQIAQKLGISKESVASHINTAKNEIRKLITVYLILLQLTH